MKISDKLKNAASFNGEFEEVSSRYFYEPDNSYIVFVPNVGTIAMGLHNNYNGHGDKLAVYIITPRSDWNGISERQFLSSFQGSRASGLSGFGFTTGKMNVLSP